MKAFDSFYGRDLTLWNTLAGEVQCAIGLGLIVSRKTVKPALLVSFVLGARRLVDRRRVRRAHLDHAALAADGRTRRGDPVRASSGCWCGRPSGEERRSPADGGPLGDRGGLFVWSALWVAAAYLWLLNVNRAKDAIHGT